MLKSSGPHGHLDSTCISSKTKLYFWRVLTTSLFSLNHVFPPPLPLLQDSHLDTSFPDQTFHSTILSCKPSNAPRTRTLFCILHDPRGNNVGLSPVCKHPKKSSTQTMQRVFQNPTDTTGFLLGSGIRHVPHTCPRWSSKYTEVLSPGEERQGTPLLSAHSILVGMKGHRIGLGTGAMAPSTHKHSQGTSE